MTLRRTLLLTLVLAALPSLLLIPGARQRVGGPVAYRHLALWGLPIAAAAAATLVSWGTARGAFLRGAPGTGRRIAPWLAAAIPADLLCLGAGHLLGWVTFTYGEQGLMEHPARSALWALPLCLVVGVFGWEWALRRTLYVSWAARIGRGPALALSCAAGVLLAAPSIVPGFDVPDAAYVAAALFTALCREAACASIFASGAGLAAAGIYRGLFTYVDAFVIDDWYGVRFPMANYTTSEPLFYALRALSALLAAAIAIAGARLAARRAQAAAAP